MDDHKTRLVTDDGQQIELALIKPIDAAATDGQTTQERLLNGLRQKFVGHKMRIDQPPLPDGTPRLILEMTVTDVRLDD